MHEDLGKELRMEMNIICSPGTQEADTGRSLVLLASLSVSVSFRFSKGHTQTQSFCPKGDCMYIHTHPHYVYQGRGSRRQRKRGGVGGKTRTWTMVQAQDHAVLLLLPGVFSPWNGLP